MGPRTSTRFLRASCAVALSLALAACSDGPGGAAEPTTRLAAPVAISTNGGYYYPDAGESVEVTTTDAESWGQLTPWVVGVTEDRATVRVVRDETSCSSSVKGRYQLYLAGGWGSEVSPWITASNCEPVYYDEEASSYSHVVLSFDLSSLASAGEYKAYVRNTSTHAQSDTVYWRQASATESLRFAVFGDTQDDYQYALAAGLWTVATSGSGENLRSTYAFGVHLGDFLAYGSTLKQNQQRNGVEDLFIDAMKKWRTGVPSGEPDAKKILTEMPIYWAPGNHDQTTNPNRSQTDPDRRWPAGDLNGWLKFFAPRNGASTSDFAMYRAHNSSGTDGDARGYVIERGRMTLIVFNSMALGTQSGDVLAYPQITQSEEFEWLQSKVKAADANRKERPWIVLAGHVFWAAGTWPDDRGVLEGAAGIAGTYGPDYRNHLQTLIDDYSVDVLLTGHSHATEYGYLGASDGCGSYGSERPGALQIVAGANNEGLEANYSTSDSSFYDSDGNTYYSTGYNLIGTRAFADVQLPGTRDTLTLKLYSYSDTSNTGNTRLKQTLTHYGRVPRSIVNRPTPTSATCWDYYGPYRNYDRNFAISLTGSGNPKLYVKKGGKPSSSSYSCRANLGGNCAIDMGSASGSSEFWIGVAGGSSAGSYSLTVTSE